MYALFLCLLSLLTITNINAYECRTYVVAPQETYNIIPSCPQCNKIILGHNFCCDFNRFLQRHNHNYQEAFMDAAHHGYHEYVELLLSLGADVNGYNDYDGKTALMWAAQYGHVETCRLLLRHGAYVDARTNWGSTALMWAAEFGHIQVCQLLINAGAHVNTHTKNNSTAYSYAKRNGHSLVCTLLVDAGATTHYGDSFFSSVPHYLIAWLAGYGAYKLFLE